MACFQLHFSYHNFGYTRRNLRFWNTILDDWIFLSICRGSYSSYLPSSLLQNASQICPLLPRTKVQQASQIVCRSVFYHAHLCLFSNSGICSSIGFGPSHRIEHGLEHWSHFHCLYLLYSTRRLESCDLDQCVPSPMHDHFMSNSGDLGRKCSGRLRKSVQTQL